MDKGKSTLKQIIRAYNEEMHVGSGLKGKALYTVDENELADFEKWVRKNNYPTKDLHKIMKVTEPKKKVIYRTTVTMVVLSDEPIGDVTMQDIVSGCDSGGWSGQTTTFEQDHPLTGRQAVNAVKRQGSAVEFFMMDEKGNELED